MNDLVRLSKRMSELNICSRREADEWIKKGWVSVNGMVVTELGTKINPSQKITIHPKARQSQDKKVTILIHKPIGYVSGQAEDGYKPAVSLINAQSRWDKDHAPHQFHPSQLKHLVPAGRLDIDSVGLLVLTQDGRIAKSLIGEQSSIEKEYLVRVKETLPFNEEKLKLLNHGLSLDGKTLLPAKVFWQNKDQLRFILKEGKKRQIRRMCDAVGLKVVGLKRIRIGKITLGNLPLGTWRYLKEDETF